MKLIHRVAHLITLVFLHSVLLSNCNESYTGTTVSGEVVEHATSAKNQNNVNEFVENSRREEFVEQNWVDCALSSKKERADCMKKIGLKMNGQRLKSKQKGGGGSHGAAKKKTARNLATSAASAAHKLMKRIDGVPTTPSQAAINAQHQRDFAAAVAASNAAAKGKAMEKLKKARAAVEKQQKKPPVGEKWEAWYKEKVHKVNLKLKSDKKAIKAKRNAAVKAAKAKARAAGAHVSDLGS